ncbi:Vanillyl-alcohol oxidase, C-terminal subdomain 1 [Niveomyces insectorum RCEF 264]|uniref:Vanillyl-alcohol oxidase, C-terminal subdomain 1 n=1 Tax=Niveomyces insectorum RCEF 264 TaxID=1081102 RepID=A0A167XY76_9HYPO|nr:Vanillyl-alcohol oxidase, C-terminal subdomain 1 [Niveomyces insectorum RCEF 264]
MSDIPTLPESHAGIPLYLLDKARATKEAVYNLKDNAADTAIPRRRAVPALPQGVTPEVFAAAMAELREQLGPEHVEVIDQALRDGWYMEHPNTHDMMTILDDEEFVASAVVYPGSTEDVQTVVRWANKHLIPIFPISMGRNLGYGGAAPRVRGSVVVDLGRRMRAILDLDADDCTCLVEPGVSFYALYDAVQERGLGDTLWVDVPDLGGGSIIGNTVDRGVGYTPYGDHWACHAGLEVVLPTGDVVRTGMGALPGNNTWQAFPYGFGPFSDGIFSQSNFGIVTKMGMTLMPNPGGHESFMYTFPREEDLALLPVEIDIIRPLRIRNILENVAQLRHVAQAIAVRGLPRSQVHPGGDPNRPVPLDVIHAAAAALPAGDYTWAYYGTTYGPTAEERARKIAVVDAAFRRIPGCRRIDTSTLPPDDYYWSRDRIASGTPDLHELRWCQWVPNGSHIAFSPVSPIRGADATALYALARRRHTEHGLDLFPAFCVGLREMHLIVELVFDRTNTAQRAAALACLRDLVEDAAALGYGEYRTHLALMDQVAGTYKWNDGALMKFHETLKDALDPRGILAPGRCGIWPKRYRGRGWEMTRASGESSEGNGVAPP